MENKFHNFPFFKNDETGNEDFGKLLEAFSNSGENLKKGSIVKGYIIDILDDHCLVDLGYKTEGILPLEELDEEERKIGKEIEVKIISIFSDEQHVILSRKDILKKKIFERLKNYNSENKAITAKIIEPIKGGFIVDIGTYAFLPGSQADPNFLKNQKGVVGKEIKVKILKIDEEQNNVIVSQKEFLKNNIKNIKEDLYPGNIVKGYIKNITEYGVFLDLGGIDGLLHKTDISWGRVKHPGDFFKVGDYINVMVLHYDEKEGKVSLGYKQLSPDPWQYADIKYKQSSIVKGKIKSFEDYGIFIELEDGIEGLVHKSEISWEKIEDPEELFSIGEELEVKIMGIDKNHRKISLSIKRAKKDIWFDFAKKYKKFSVLEGTVKKIDPPQILVEVEKDIIGNLKTSIEKDNSLFNELKEGDKIEVSILSINPYKHKLSLGYKKFETKRWEEFFANHAEGDIVEGEIAHKTRFGVFVRLSEGVEALCHISELDKKLEELNVGEKIKVKITSMNLSERKIGISTKELIPLRERIKKQILELEEEGKND